MFAESRGRSCADFRCSMQCMKLMSSSAPCTKRSTLISTPQPFPWRSKAILPDERCLGEEALGAGGALQNTSATTATICYDGHAHQFGYSTVAASAAAAVECSYCRYFRCCEHFHCCCCCSVPATFADVSARPSKQCLSSYPLLRILRADSA